MFGQKTALRRIEQRGPRYAVYGVIRAGEARTEYADTAEQAERIRASFEDPRDCGYRQVKVHPPEGSVDLAALGQARAKAKATFDEATAVLRAAVLRALEQPGSSEVQVAREAGVDRMTVRKWAGKQ